MCWVAVAAVATVVGSALSAYGQIQSGRAAAQAADYNATVTRNQAIATQQEGEVRAQQEQAQASADERTQRDRFRRLQATALASLGTSGQTGEGSATDLLAENASQGELDALTIRYGGQVRADNLRRAAANSASALNSQAALYQFEGQQRKFSSYLGAGTTLLQAAGSFGSTFKWGNNGLEFARSTA